MVGQWKQFYLDRNQRRFFERHLNYVIKNECQFTRWRGCGGGFPHGGTTTCKMSVQINEFPVLSEPRPSVFCMPGTPV